MKRRVGVTVRSLRTPIFREGDDLVEMVSALFMDYIIDEKIEIGTKDVLAITESVIARAQGNYVSVDEIAKDIKEKYNSDDIAIVFPILSRNRFSLILKAIARAVNKKVIILFSYPADEVGNHLVYASRLDETGVNPWTDELNEEEFRKHFGYEKHIFTGIDYIEYYKEIIEAEGKEAEFIFSNKAVSALKKTDNILLSDIHTRERNKKILKKQNCRKLYSLDDILTKSIDGKGYNEKYGLLGSNKASEESLKLFPRDAQDIVEKIQAKIKELSGKSVEVMVYGDGAFKDPVGKIWELADPVVSPGFTSGLKGTPSEIKLKYIADNDFADLEGDELINAMNKYIEEKSDELVGKMSSEGTTPRQITDLLGSLCDISSGSGDKGTPIVHIQGYFDNFADK